MRKLVPPAKRSKSLEDGSRRRAALLNTWWRAQPNTDLGCSLPVISKRVM